MIVKTNEASRSSISEAADIYSCGCNVTELTILTHQGHRLFVRTVVQHIQISGCLETDRSSYLRGGAGAIAIQRLSTDEEDYNLVLSSHHAILGAGSVGSINRS